MEEVGPRQPTYPPPNATVAAANRRVPGAPQPAATAKDKAKDKEIDKQKKEIEKLRADAKKAAAAPAAGTTAAPAATPAAAAAAIAAPISPIASTPNQASGVQAELKALNADVVVAKRHASDCPNDQYLAKKLTDLETAVAAKRAQLADAKPVHGVS